MAFETCATNPRNTLLWRTFFSLFYYYYFDRYQLTRNTDACQNYDQANILLKTIFYTLFFYIYSSWAGFWRGHEWGHAIISTILNHIALKCRGTVWHEISWIAGPDQIRSETVCWSCDDHVLKCSHTFMQMCSCVYECGQGVTSQTSSWTCYYSQNVYFLIQDYFASWWWPLFFRFRFNIWKFHYFLEGAIILTSFTYNNGPAEKEI